MRSVCPSCRKDSETVDGACTNCWALKQRGVESGFAPARTEPFWKDGSDYGWLWASIGGAGSLGLAALAVLVLGFDALIVGAVVLVVLGVGWALLTGALP